jgi:hypothetical protein
MSFDNYLSDILRLAHNARAAGDKKAVTALVERYAREAGVSKPTAYSIFKKQGLIEKRKARADKGTSKVSVEDAQKVARTQQETQRRARHKILYPLNESINVCRELDCITEASDSTYRRALKRIGYDPQFREGDRPYIMLRSLRPGDVLQVDASQPVQWYVSKNGRYELNFQRGLLEYKDDKRREGPLKRYLVTDHKTGAVWPYYVEAKGERAIDYIRIIWEATKYKGDDIPMAGLPRLIYSDPGSGLTATIFQNVFATMGVELKAHEAHHPRSKGTVESSMRRWEEKFELGLIARGIKFFSVEELNVLAFNWAMQRNRTHVNKKLKSPAFPFWTKWLAEHPEYKPVYPPEWETIKRMATGLKKSRRVHAGMQLWYNTRLYILSPLADYSECQKGCEVRFVEDPFAPTDILVMTDDGQRHRIKAQVMEDGVPVDAPVMGREFKSLPDDMATKAYKVVMSLPLPAAQKPADIVAFDNSRTFVNSQAGTAGDIPRHKVSRAQWWDEYVSTWGVHPVIARKTFEARYGEKAAEGYEDEIGVAWHEENAADTDSKQA